MMRVECKKVENCFVSTHMYAYYLDMKISEEFVQAFSAFGVVVFHKKFPRPFFKVTLTNGTTIKGVLNDTVIKAQYPDNDPQTSKQVFEKLLDELLQRNKQMKEVTVDYE
ncbi:MAG: hypothetical protein WCS30_02815 [Selenomonadaceae bacterium]